MKKGFIILIVVAALLIVSVLACVGGYNSLVQQQTEVEEELANIDAQLQRRMDLIPNLVETVQSFTTHETEVLTSITESREKLLAANTMQEKAKANDAMTTALNGLIAVAEAYPTLTSNTVYVGLMDELAGTENRISVARINYNKDVASYNAAIRKFPTNLYAGLFGFEKYDLFAAEDGAQTAPQIKFN